MICLVARVVMATMEASSSSLSSKSSSSLTTRIRCFGKRSSHCKCVMLSKLSKFVNNTETLHRHSHNMYACRDGETVHNQVSDTQAISQDSTTVSNLVNDFGTIQRYAQK